jgi:hypothetical protein
VQESWLRAFALGLAVIGTVFLFWYDSVTEPENVRVWELSLQHVDKKIQTSGRMESMWLEEKTVFFPSKTEKK